MTNRRAASSFEYGLIAALIAVVLMVGLQYTGGRLSGVFTGKMDQAFCYIQNNSVKEGCVPRSGAICKDGWQSSSTGAGTCSSHGGVDYWLYQW